MRLNTVGKCLSKWLTGNSSCYYYCRFCMQCHDIKFLAVLALSCVCTASWIQCALMRIDWKWFQSSSIASTLRFCNVNPDNKMWVHLSLPTSRDHDDVNEGQWVPLQWQCFCHYYSGSFVQRSFTLPQIPTKPSSPHYHIRQPWLT